MVFTSHPGKIPLWQERFKQFENSKLSIPSFCKSVGCCEATFYYWKRKVAESSQSPTPAKTIRNRRTRSFVQVLVKPSQSQSVIVMLSNGTKIELQCDAMKALLVVLEVAKKAS
jgi:transposase-like protein